MEGKTAQAIAPVTSVAGQSKFSKRMPNITVAAMPKLANHAVFIVIVVAP